LEANKLELHLKFAKLLCEYQQRDPELQRWRFDLHQSRGLELGMKNNKIGGPYSNPGFKESISGEIYLIWSDDRFTSAKLDSQFALHFNEYMNLWKATVYQDPDGAGIYQPENIPQVPLADHAAEMVAIDDFKPAFQLLDRGLNELHASGIKKVDAKLRCFQSHRFILNSLGLEINYRHTPVEFYFVANDSYGKGFGEKHWPTEREIADTIGETARVGKLLGRTADPKLMGPISLILPPETFETLLSHFLMTNLFGSLVVNRQSRFSVEDFHRQRQVLREDLDLYVDPLQPYRSFAYNCTAEAVPAKQQTFIEKGRLITPVLNLKYAKKTGMEPTAIPGGGFFIRSAQPMESWERLIERTSRGLIVYSVLGLHTQDASSGQFSLTADQCLMVENGKITGKVKAVINGDFLGSLLKQESCLCKVEGEDNPGYMFTANALT
jgi:PmbA protein